MVYPVLRHGSRLRHLFENAGEALGVGRRRPSYAEGPDALLHYMTGRPFSDFTGILTYGLPRGTRTELCFEHGEMADPAHDLFRRGYDRVLAVSVFVENEGGVASDKFSLDFSKGEISPGMVATYRSMAGLGVGRRMVANRGLMGQAAGIQNFRVYASLEMGGYVWAKSGLRVDRRDHEALSGSVGGRLARLDGVIPQDVWQEAKLLSLLRRPDDIRRLAGMDYDMRAHGALYTNPNMSFEEGIQRGYLKGHLGLGKFLLSGQAYHGSYHFGSAAQMAHFRRYVGGAVLLEEIADILPGRDAKTAPGIMRRAQDILRI